MDPLLQPPLRIQTQSTPEAVSVQDARETLERFITDYKNHTSGGDAPQEDASGSVLLSQLARLRDGLSEA